MHAIRRVINRFPAIDYDAAIICPVIIGIAIVGGDATSHSIPIGITP